MKKTLRKESEIFFSYSGGQITPWDASDENVLVIAANHGLKHVFEETTLYIDERMIFESAAAAWLTQLVENGVTEQLIDELNDQHTILSGYTDQHYDADLTIDIERLVGKHQSKQTAGQSQWHSDHNDQRMDKALEL